MLTPGAADLVATSGSKLVIFMPLPFPDNGKSSGPKHCILSFDAEFLADESSGGPKHVIWSPADLASEGGGSKVLIEMPE